MAKARTSNANRPARPARARPAPAGATARRMPAGAARARTAARARIAARTTPADTLPEDLTLLRLLGRARAASAGGTRTFPARPPSLARTADERQLALRHAAWVLAAARRHAPVAAELAHQAALLREHEPLAGLRGDGQRVAVLHAIGLRVVSAVDQLHLIARPAPSRRSARRAPGLCRWHISRGDAVLLDAPAAAVVRLSDLLLTAVELAELKGSRKHRAHLAKALLAAALQARAIFPGVTVQRRPAGSRTGSRTRAGNGSAGGRLLWTRHAPAIVPGRSDLSRARRLLATLTPEQELALVNAATAALEARAPDGGLEVAEKDLLVDLRDYVRSLQRTAR
ncbi:MAG: hypothetical protein LW650_13850 [Planctomycetaceae bacterium]|jgi:hypothetical protein|nr:hypothetical protein [Phycisphaerales bacterium]MCE2654484.1 hypothetical protein [Planctomycetaceae bacterium]